MTAAVSRAMTGVWIGTVPACEILGGICPETLRRLAATGKVTCRRVPGAKAKYLLESVEKLAESSTRYAEPAATRATDTSAAV